MTRVTHDRILKDANENISDHLRNHIHLTNCIHLKNMHKHSPILADKSLMRDLAVLQRSRSLRDPSTSPPSWRSPAVVDLLLKKQENEAVIGNGRRSVGIECSRDIRRMLGSSPTVVGSCLSKGASGKLSGKVDRAAAASDGSISSGAHEREISSARGNRLPNYIGDRMEPTPTGDENTEGHESLSASRGFKNKHIEHKGEHGREDRIKTLSEQLHEISGDTDDAASTHADIQRRYVQGENLVEETQTTIPRHSTGPNRGKRRKFRGSRRNRAPVTSHHANAHSEMSVASNSLAHGRFYQKYNLKDGDEDYVHHNVREAPKHGCGVPLNWSRIHNRGKSFLDMAGRSFSCGLHESVLKKGGSGTRRNVPDLPTMSDNTSSSVGPDAESFPLLIDASGSQGSTENAAWFHDYSGELGIFAQDLLNRELDSDLASEARSGERHKAKGFRNGRHQSLTQKYMPKTFRDLVGQTLVAQALSNAVMKRKVGLLYVFYGPHGTGKTTAARVFARALNCQSGQHLKPCGVCNSCIAHDSGKSRTIKEIGPVSSFDYKGIMNLLESMIVPQMPSQYRVSIFDDCDTLSPDCWSSIVKVIDRAPRRVVLILICSSLDVLPHIIISRCQKFFFPKMKDADIIYTLQRIASKEDLEIDKDALKVIASKSDGSLRDAEMTLEQLSLLGQRISVSLVQEMVGLISDEKLVDLLDLALSADTVNTVKNLREIMESGVEPLALMSQLATAITDILAGGYDFTREGRGRKFFRRQTLSKEDMEKLRQALKTLSEAEKQLRMSNDKLTWLTAVLLQLAPDQQYLLPNSSADNSFMHSPTDSKNPATRLDRPRKSSAAEMPNNGRGSSTGARTDHSENKAGPSIDQRSHAITALVPHSHSSDKIRSVPQQLPAAKLNSEIEEIWFDVLDKIHINSIRQFLLEEGKLISVSFSAASTVQLLFSSHLAKSKADKFKAHILEAFESVLGPPVMIEIRFESSKDPIILPATKEMNPGSNSKLIAGYDNTNRKYNGDRDTSNHVQFKSSRADRSEIVELETSSKEIRGGLNIRNELESARQGVEVGGSKHMRNKSLSDSKRKLGDRNGSLSIVRGKVSLAHVIQQAEGYSQQNGWSKCKAVSIAEKLEQENLRLEPRSRSLLCWRASRGTRQKHSRLKVRTRKPETLLKFVSCGRCLSGRSSR